MNPVCITLHKITLHEKVHDYRYVEPSKERCVLVLVGDNY